MIISVYSLKALISYFNTILIIFNVAYLKHFNIKFTNLELQKILYFLQSHSVLFIKIEIARI